MTDEGERHLDDERIGRAVESARGSMTQTAAAQYMRELGYKWSQATVWAVEKGKRALKLGEARDLAVIFGVSVLDLLESESDSASYVWIRGELAAMSREIDQLTEAIIQWSARRERLYQVGLWLDEDDNALAIPESKFESTKREIINAVNLALRDFAYEVQSEDWDMGRLEQLDDDNPPPFDLSDIEVGGLLNHAWRQLPDPENEARLQGIVEQVLVQRNDDGLDLEAP